MPADPSMIENLPALAAVPVMAAIIILLIHHINRMRRERDVLLQEKDVVFNFFYDVGEVFSRTDMIDVPALLHQVVSSALRTSRGGAGALFLADDERHTLRAASVSGVFPPLVGKIDDGIETAFSKVRYIENLVREQAIQAGEGVLGEVLLRGTPLLIQDGDLDNRLPRFKQDFLQVHSALVVPMRFRGEVQGVLAVINRIDGKSFSQSDLDLLQALADQASVSVYYAQFSKALEEKRRLDHDLGVARSIQEALLPREIPRLPGVDLAAFSVPAKQIGGDYYDFVDVDDGHLGIVIADVAGKGVAGAIIMTACRSLFHVKAKGCQSPATVLAEINTCLSPDLRTDMFVSVLYMILDLRTHSLTVARAGHMYPVIKSVGQAEPRLLKSDGIAVGLADAATFEASLEEKTVQLEPGDMVVAYTDGVTEARDAAGREWGLLNLIQAMQTTAYEGKGSQALARNVRQKLLQFAGDMPQYDDLTLVAVGVMDAGM